MNYDDDKWGFYAICTKILMPVGVVLLYGLIMLLWFRYRSVAAALSVLTSSQGVRAIEIGEISNIRNLFQSPTPSPSETPSEQPWHEMVVTVSTRFWIFIVMAALIVILVALILKYCYKKQCKSIAVSTVKLNECDRLTVETTTLSRKQSTRLGAPSVSLANLEIN